MATLNYEIEIDAPRKKVWDIMLQPDTYRQWTAAFQEGSYYEGSWEQNSPIRFVSDSDGGNTGIFGFIAESEKPEKVIIEYKGEVHDGKDDESHPNSAQWKGAQERYFFEDLNGRTLLKIELEGEGMNEHLVQEFSVMWPKALEKLKQLCEQV